MLTRHSIQLLQFAKACMLLACLDFMLCATEALPMFVLVAQTM